MEWNTENTPLDSAPISDLAKPLIQWFEQNARVLPWRSTLKKQISPYGIWVSEIMLQQTRVEAVKGYYTRFLRALPDIQALAEVSEDRLLKLWEGLGYYSRARNLQKAAKAVVSQYGGELPADYRALKSLPGIGPYTAGAVASLAFRIPVPAVDGNVLRVVSRILDSHLDISQPETKSAVETMLSEVMSAGLAHDRPDLFNQALMELGAVVCIPNGAPQCFLCPVRELCLGFRRGTAEDLPVKAPKKPRRIEERTVLLLRQGKKAALRKRPGKGLLAGMWELPNIEGFYSAGELETCLQLPKESILSVKDLGEARHIFTHIQWEMRGFEINLSDQCVLECLGDLVWETPAVIRKNYPLPSALKAYHISI